MKDELIVFVSRVKERLGPLRWGGTVVFVAIQFGAVATILTKVALGRILPGMDFGALDPISSVLSILSIPISAIYQIGMKSVSRLRSMNREDECRALVGDMIKLALFGSIAAVFVVYFLRHLLLTRLHLDSDFYVYLIMGTFILAWWEPLYGTIIQGRRNYGLMCIAFGLSPLAVLVLTFMLVGWLSLGLKGVLLARICGSLVMVAIMFFLLRSVLSGPKRSYREEWATMRGMLAPMLFFTVGSSLLVNFDRLFVRNFCMDHSAGYGALATIGSIPFYLMQSFVMVVFPLVAAEHASGRDIRRYYRQALGIGGAIVLLCVAAAWLFAEPLMRLWNAAAFLPYAGFLWIYVLAMGLYGIIQIVASVEMARHRYGFLWALMIPTIVMCAVMYWVRASISLPMILACITVARVVILLGMWGVGMMRKDAQG